MIAPGVNSRILFVAENHAVHAGFREVLTRARNTGRTEDAAAESSGDATSSLSVPDLDIDSAYSSEQGVQRVTAARRDERPYAIALVDTQPLASAPGLATIRALLAADDALQIVLCVAHGDCGLEDILLQLAATGRVTLLRMPFAIAETWLLTRSLLDKWWLTHDTQGRSQRQADQLANTRRVMVIIESCLDELESTHDELCDHASLLMRHLEQRQAEIAGTRDLTMFALAQLADSRDPETGEHLLRMRAYAQLLAEHLSTNGPYVDEIDRKFLADFYRSTPLHDIGKVGIPDQTLLKPGALTHEEFEIMKRHTIIGADALEKAAQRSSFGDFLKMAAVIARSHHEKFDGTGYPDGLRGNSIPLCARITAVADVFDALTSARVYKDAMPCEEARRLIIAQASRHFDPAVVAAFVACYDEFLTVKAMIDKDRAVPGRATVRSVPPLPLIEPEPLLGNFAMLATI